MTAGSQQKMIQRAVVGDEKKAFRILVQPSHGSQLLLRSLREIIHDCLGPAVSRCRDAARRLMEHIPGKARSAQDFAVKAHLVGFLRDPGLRFFHRFSVDPDPSFFQISFYLASRSHSRVRQPFIQSYLAHKSLHPVQYLFFSVPLFSFPKPRG